MARSNLVALPSVSYSLSTLPQATSLDGVALHPNAMSNRHAAESEAKVARAPVCVPCACADRARAPQLRKAISKSSSSHAPPAYLPPVRRLPWSSARPR